MFILMPVIFVLGILAIALEDKIKINKAAIALFMAISLWMILMFDAYDIFVERSSPLFQEFLIQNPEMANAPLKDQFITFITNRSIVYHLGNVAETLFFVMCSMLIVDIVDKHGGFRAVTGYIRTANKRKLLWYISFAAFFFSALLDNLAAAIVIMAVLRKLVPDRNGRRIYTGNSESFAPGDLCDRCPFAGIGSGLSDVDESSALLRCFAGFGDPVVLYRYHV